MRWSLIVVVLSLLSLSLPSIIFKLSLKVRVFRTQTERASRDTTLLYYSPMEVFACSQTTNLASM